MEIKGYVEIDSSTLTVMCLRARKWLVSSLKSYEGKIEEFRKHDDALPWWDFWTTRKLSLESDEKNSLDLDAYFAKKKLNDLRNLLRAATASKSVLVSIELWNSIVHNAQGTRVTDDEIEKVYKTCRSELE